MASSVLILVNVDKAGKYLIQPVEASGYCLHKDPSFCFLFAEQENRDILFKSQGRSRKFLRKKLFVLSYSLWNVSGNTFLSQASVEEKEILGISYLSIRL